MRACRKYWLIAVSSLNSTLFRCCTTLGSPFIGGLGGKARFDAEGLAASTDSADQAATATGSSARASRSTWLAQSRQRPQPAPTPSSYASSSIEQAPLRAHSRTAFSVTALQMQMYKAGSSMRGIISSNQKKQQAVSGCSRISHYDYLLTTA